MNVRTTVRLPPSLLDKAKRKARREGRTLTALIEDGLRRVVDERPPGKRTLPPTFASDPPLPPGALSVEAIKAIFEQDDIDYIERLKNGFK